MFNLSYGQQKSGFTSLTLSTAKVDENKDYQERKAKFLKICDEIWDEDNKLVDGILKKIKNKIVEQIKKARDESKALMAENGVKYACWGSQRDEEAFKKAYKTITSSDLKAQVVDHNGKKRLAITLEHYKAMIIKADNIYESNRAALSHLKRRIAEHKEIALAGRYDQYFIDKELKWQKKRKEIHKAIKERAKQYEQDVSKFYGNL